MRRRLRQQRGMREALLLDLGALVFELHRHGRREPELLQAKAAELTAVDNEVRALSEALEEDLGVVELVAAGITGSCQECGSLLSTDARFCATCGRAARPGLEARQAPPPEEIGPADQPTVSQEAAEVEIVTDPDPDLEPEPEPEPEPPRPTGDSALPAAPWLAADEPGNAPEPMPLRRPQSRLERLLRGKHDR